MPDLTVLVVDDEEAIRVMLQTALPGHGFSVLVAASGTEAIEVFRQHNCDISLVILDVQMPDMDGPATFAVLQTLNSDVRIVFMSGHIGKYTRDELLAMGAVRVIAKPFPSLNDVAATLRRLATP